MNPKHKELLLRLKYKMPSTSQRSRQSSMRITHEDFSLPTIIQKNKKNLRSTSHSNCFITTSDLQMTSQTSSCKKVKLGPLEDDMVITEQIETAKLHNLISSCKSIDTKGTKAKFGRNSSLLNVSRKRNFECSNSLDVLQRDQEHSHGYKIKSKQKARIQRLESLANRDLSIHKELCGSSKLNDIFFDMSANQITAEEIDSTKEFNEQFLKPAQDFSRFKIYQKPIPKMHKLPPEEKMQKYKEIHDQFKVIRKMNEAIFAQMRSTCATEIDHINKNIHMQSKIGKIRDIRTVVRNQSHDRERQEIITFTEELDQVQREIAQQQIKKWPNFKHERRQAIEQYIIARKNVFKIQYILSMIQLNKIINHVWSNWSHRKKLRDANMKLWYAYLRCCALWKRLIIKYGVKDGIKKKQMNKIRHAFTFINHLQKPQDRAKWIIGDFCKRAVDWVMIVRMKSQTKKLHGQIKFMQVRMRAITISRNAKVEILSNMWDNYIYRWYDKAIRMKDDGMKALITAIMQVKPEIKLYVLKAYVDQCSVRHSIAFFQWRLLYCKARRTCKNQSTQLEDEQIQLLIDQRISQFEALFQEFNQNLNLTDQMIESSAFHTTKALKYYEMNQPRKFFYINDLASLGWPDPFLNGIYNKNSTLDRIDQIQQYREKCQKLNDKIIQNDDCFFERLEHKKVVDSPERKKDGPKQYNENNSDLDTLYSNKNWKTIARQHKDQSERKLVYQVERYIPDKSPISVYIPSNLVLFKMMRACISCQVVEDLWIYQNK